MIFEKLRALIAEQFNVDADTITLDTSFADDLNADSVDIVDLSMALEEEFGIDELGEDEASSISTVNNNSFVSAECDCLFSSLSYVLTDNSGDNFSAFSGCLSG